MSDALRETDGIWDAIIGGGGLAGLTAAALAAKNGLKVRLLEQSKQFGGRAGTTRRDGISFNLGPHALYLKGEACRTLQELGIELHGGPPIPGEPCLMLGGRVYAWPQTAPALLRSSLFTLSEKWKLAGFLNRIKRADPGEILHLPVSEWTRQFTGGGNFEKLLRTLVRLTTFTNDPEHQSAGEALKQIVLGNQGVMYLDHGWQTMIDDLAGRAESLGATISTGAAVVKTTPLNDLWETKLKDGTILHSRSVIVAVPPQAAAKLLNLPAEHPLSQQIPQIRSGYAASLDVALDTLPRPEKRFCLGLDEPLYYSVDSDAATVGPSGVAVLHVMKYIDSESSESPEETEQQLERMLDRLQPGWRAHVRRRQFLPHLLAVSNIPLARLGGNAGRPTVEVAGHPGLFLAGDWVGETGQLSDAAVASAKAAVAGVIDSLSATPLLDTVS